jgi:hypothetical protein
MTSFIANGTPFNGDGFCLDFPFIQFCQAMSALVACCMAKSELIVTKAFIRGSDESMRLRHASVNSTLVASPVLSKLDTMAKDW